MTGNLPTEMCYNGIGKDVINIENKSIVTLSLANNLFYDYGIRGYTINHCG
ncbi:hypothetical protein SDC9_08947 [bioreactor metagenome]|uniref:Uncharacterized protein n=1 Tax=bioreactor metagenome TaxID=1076179 RepID=A0A644TBS5_9ZZZZ